MRRQIGDELVLSSGENKCQVRLAITNRDLQLTWLPSPAILYMEDIQDTASLGEGSALHARASYLFRLGSQARRGGRAANLRSR